MTMLQPKNLWWETITGPVQLVEEVITALFSQKIVLLKYSFPLPFLAQLQDTIYDHLLEKNREIQILFLDLSGYTGDVSIDFYFLKQVSESSQIDQYRSSEKVVNFLEKHRIIQSKFIWVEGISAQYQKEWQNFFRSFPSSLLEESFLVVPWNELFYLKEAQRFQILEYRKMVHYHDTRLFCHLLIHQSMGEKSSYYFSSVASHMSGSDGELAEFLLSNTNFYQENPITFVEQNIERYLQGYEEEDFDKNHLVSCINNHGLKNRVWNAQVEVLFPHIELYYRSIIKQWETDIAGYLSEYEVVQFNVVLTEPYEVELGTLHYLSQKITTFDQTTCNHIDFLRQCRNFIAHGNLCSIAEVNRLFSEFNWLEDH